ncbi:hypothetical protein D0T12_28950 [Actinomadura spongiicola]|uniref:Uncharacterized protein n=1 Tax=Actinomadura spongiicola TaxID=2303421 RepID=A0A372GA61_9ACTN|nr:hypothetical protein [Actinomadura spongiicola]RFS82264.1 hypothetical protein D0T12_28950 [Actinomadura spongiicola]
MNSIPTEETPLAGYQERRLAELTAVVAARQEQGASAVRSPRRLAHPRSAWGIAGALGAATAVTAGLLTWTGSAQPAYAVTRDPSGLVTVKVTQEILDSRNADALSRELRSLGVPATVYSIPEGKVCPQPHAKPVDLPPNVYDMPDGLYTVPSRLPRPSGGWKMTINPGNFRPGQFMIWTLTTSGIYDESNRRTGNGTSVGTYLVSGRAIPCDYRPAQHPQAPHPAVTKVMGQKDGQSVSVTDTGGFITFSTSP